MVFNLKNENQLLPDKQTKNQQLTNIQSLKLITFKPIMILRNRQTKPLTSNVPKFPRVKFNYKRKEPYHYWTGHL